MEKIALEKLDTNGVTTTQIGVDNGLKESSRQRVAAGLSKLLADSYYLLLKTHNYHWNVRGSLFHTLHVMTEEQYNELFTAIDEIAERIRALGFITPARFSEFQNMTTLSEGDGELNQQEMIADLVQSHEEISKTCRRIVETADKLSDDVTVDMITGRLEVHDKNAWMLRSLLEK